MKTLLATALLACALAPSFASAEPLLQEMSCADAQGFVAHHNFYHKVNRLGDVVAIYPVYHAAPNCNGGSNAGRVNYIYEQTADSDHCFVGFRCGGK